MTPGARDARLRRAKHIFQANLKIAANVNAREITKL
jgi:hypothetical protein